MSEPMIPQSIFNRDCQLSHFGWGAWLTLAPMAMGARLPLEYAFIAPIVIVLVAAWKEFDWDAKNEPEEIRGSDAEDFFFYCVGSAFGVSLIVLSHFLGWRP